MRSPSLRRTSCSTRPKPRLAMKGNGCAGSMASGVSTGKTSDMNISSSQARSAGSRSCGPMMAMPAAPSSWRSARQRHLLVVHQLAGADVDRLELLGRGQAVLARRHDAGEDMAFEAGDAHHVEFVEVVRRDRQKAQPLQQGMPCILGLAQNSFVERKPGKLSVDEPGFLVNVDRHCRRATCLGHERMLQISVSAASL